MAISFSRPDPSSPAAIGSASFSVIRRGFDQGEVRDFLRMVAAELARLQERERFLENELRAMQTRGVSAPGRLDEETVTTLLGEEAARVLSTARDASTQIRERAEESATRLVKEAAEDASRIREAAMLEAARVRDDAASDAESEIEMAKQQGRDMVNEAREYREKVLSELGRRRDAARAQIEQLLHGRDRLINAFQRARIATDDVIGELTDAHDEPEFIIDLAPTTGPVPLVNPAHPSATGKTPIFDREAENHDEQDRKPAPDARSVGGNPAPMIDVPIDEPVTTDSGNHGPDMVVVADDGPDVVVEEVAAAVVEDAASIDHDVAETSPSNVVSLFGRNRIPAPVPEIPPVHEQPESEGHTEHVRPDPGPTGKAPTTGTTLDDIFTKLRSSTVADVVSPDQGTRKDTGREKDPVKDREKDKAGTKKKVESTRPTVVPSDPTVFARRSEVLAPVVGSIARHLKRVLVDEQNRALGHVGTKRSSLDPDAVTGTREEQAARYAQAILGDAMTIAGAAAKNAGGSTRRISADQITSAMTKAVADSIVDEFRRDLDVAIGEAEGNREILTELLRDVYRAWKAQKIDGAVEMIAHSAHGSGVSMSLEPGAMVSWMVPIEGCCSDCEDNSLAGAQGRDSTFPTGHVSAPAHTGCRCLVWPVRK